MGYRMSVKGNIEGAEATLCAVEEILGKRKIDCERAGSQVIIDYSERNMNPGDHRIEKALSEIAEHLDGLQSIKIWDEFHGETEFVVGSGRVRSECSENIWSQLDSVPTPEEIMTHLRRRGFQIRLTKVKGRRGGARQFEFHPLAGGPGVRVTLKPRFWDSFDLLAVPDVVRKLCDRYRLKEEELRDKLHGSTFGMEVRNPAAGGDTTDELYESVLQVIERLTMGIRTTVG